ncbi:MAG TPA: metal ABC transporter ATP-binding protein [Solirubrobacteraceae bacterium]|jgi:zinc/manganese transport system ATP-binding protein|nr:metal ABC transporter ATP-binding protein [Solirubrobacteraceae bacterium]
MVSAGDPSVGLEALAGDGAESSQLAGSEPILSVRDVGVRLSGRQILDDVSFAIAPGEFTGLIGSNGAGKTTLLRVILGLQAPSAGSVLVAGRPRSQRESTIGYVPQKFLLDPDMPMRARDLVALGLDGNRLGFALPSRARRELVERALESVGAGGYADARVGTLSGGEQQRVLIAHALIGKPRLLLLDEPLANLDLGGADEVVALLSGIAQRERIAVLISAHEMNPLVSAMDRIVYLAGGRAASGTTEEVVRADVLSALYGHHVDVLRVHGRLLVVAGAGEPSDLDGHEVAFPAAGEVVS